MNWFSLLIVGLLFFQVEFVAFFFLITFDIVIQIAFDGIRLNDVGLISFSFQQQKVHQGQNNNGYQLGLYS